MNRDRKPGWGTDRVTNLGVEEMRIGEGRAKDIVGQSSEKALKEIDEFERSLGVNGFDAADNGTVLSVEPYEVSW